MRRNILITSEMVRAQSGEAAQLLTKLNKLDRNSKQARKIRRQLRGLGVNLSGKPIELPMFGLKRKFMRERIEREKHIRKMKVKLPIEKDPLVLDRIAETREHVKKTRRKLKYEIDVVRRRLRRQRERAKEAMRLPIERRERVLREGTIDQVLDTAQQLVLAGYKSDEKIASRLLELYPKIDGERAIVAAKKALFKKNPKRRFKSNPSSGAKEIYNRIYAIEAQKGLNSNYPKENFRHDFKPGAKIFGLPDGSILIKGKKRLWNEFKA